MDETKSKFAARPKSDPILFGGMDSAKEIAVKLIAQHHSHLAEAKFLFLSRSKATKSGGSLVPGSIAKASPKDKYLASAHMPDNDEPDFIAVISLDVWNDWQPNQRVAFIDHLLTRCVAEEEEESGEMKYSLRPPQVQEFPEVVARNGSWNEQLQNMAVELSK